MINQKQEGPGFSAQRRVLQIGMLLLVLASACLIASAVPPTDAYASLADAPPPLLRIEGYLRAKGPDKWVVDDTPIGVGSHTTIIEKRGLAEVGARIVVWADMQSDGWYAAQIIYVEIPAGAPGPTVELTGILTKYYPKTWVVEQTVVQITEQTKIKGAPRVGCVVWILAESSGDTLRAIRAEVMAETLDETLVEFEGVLREMGSSTWLVEEQRIRLAPNVEILGAPAVGVHVEVRARLGADELPIAEVIRVVDVAAEASLGAYIAAITPDESDSTVWEGVMFPASPWANPRPAKIHVDGNTLVDESRGVSGAGQWAEIRGFSMGNNEYKADHIRIEQPVRVTISGVANSVAAGQAETAIASTSSAETDPGGRWWNINGRQVWMTGSAAGAQSAGAAGAGEIVIHGLLLGNGVIWAEEVDTSSPPATH